MTNGLRGSIVLAAAVSLAACSSATTTHSVSRTPLAQEARRATERYQDVAAATSRPATPCSSAASAVRRAAPPIRRPLSPGRWGRDVPAGSPCLSAPRSGIAPLGL